MSEQDMLESIYFETQEPGSMLCAEHAINNLLQSRTFTPQDLSELARNLDRLEAAQLSQTSRRQAGPSQNYDDTGFYSIGVIEEALKMMGMKLIRWGSEEMKSYREKPESIEGYILNHQLHWYTLRKFGSPGRFYTLDSCTAAPVWISELHLGLQLREAAIQGYSIFAVIPDTAIGLPICAATTFGKSHPVRNSISSTSRATVSFFTGAGNTLGSGSGTASSSSSSKPSSSSRPLDSTVKTHGTKRGVDFDSDNDSVEIMDDEVSDESEKRRTRRRVGDLVLPSNGEYRAGSSSGSSNAKEKTSPRKKNFLTEDEEFEAAIRASMQESAPSTSDSTRQASTSTSSATVTTTASKKPNDSASKSQAGKGRGESEEDSELEAALLASMASLGSSTPEVEEDDSPSVEELRRRRLARFG